MNELMNCRTLVNVVWLYTAFSKPMYFERVKVRHISEISVKYFMGEKGLLSIVEACSCACTLLGRTNFKFTRASPACGCYMVVIWMKVASVWRVVWWEWSHFISVLIWCVPRDEILQAPLEAQVTQKSLSH